MKKACYRVIALVLVCIVVTSLPVSANAPELDLSSDFMPIEAENGPDAGFFSGERISGLPFTMTAANITRFLSSQVADKGFLPNNYGRKNIYVNGTLHHSVVNGKIRSGICYFSSSQGVYIPEVYSDTTSGGSIYTYMPANNMLQGITHFGYIRNDQGSGSVNSGTITIYPEIENR